MKLQADVIILGGGIAGLWTLARLRQAGYQAFLIESKRLGGVQSIASQGIIHGGSKYALGGKLGDSAKAIGEMPAIWQGCLSGQGEIDLSSVQVLAESQLMWSTASVVSKMAGFFAGKVMQSRMLSLAKKDFPPPFDSPAFKGSLYQLNEPVLDTASLMSALFRQLEPWCLAGEAHLDTATPHELVCESGADRLMIKTAALVLAAGAGNEALLRQLQRSSPAMQRRPVHMTMAKGNLPLIYAHCLGASANPRITITSKQMAEGQVAWYMGGQVAETGIDRDEAQQIAACRKEVAEVLPWLDLKDLQWATVMLDRAEIATAGNKRPENSYARLEEGVITVWPTKLAFAPRVAADVEALVRDSLSSPATTSPVECTGWPRPELALQPWEAVKQWN